MSKSFSSNMLISTSLKLLSILSLNKNRATHKELLNDIKVQQEQNIKELNLNNKMIFTFIFLILGISTLIIGVLMYFSHIFLKVDYTTSTNNAIILSVVLFGSIITAVSSTFFTICVLKNHYINKNIGSISHLTLSSMFDKWGLPVPHKLQKVKWTKLKELKFVDIRDEEYDAYSFHGLLIFIGHSQVFASKIQTENKNEKLKNKWIFTKSINEVVFDTDYKKDVIKAISRTILKNKLLTHIYLTESRVDYKKEVMLIKALDIENIIAMFILIYLFLEM